FDPPVRLVAAELAKHRVQRVAALPWMAGCAQRERQAEQQRGPPLLRPRTGGQQAKRRLQPLRGGTRRLRLDGARGLGPPADRPEVAELGGTLDMVGPCGERRAAVR